jgi:hypothetical protein
MQAATPVTWPLIYTCLMFGGMGLLSKFSPMAMAVLMFGSASVGLAIILILEYNRPYTSTIRVRLPPSNRRS